MFRASGFIVACVLTAGVSLPQTLLARAEALESIDAQPLASALDTWARRSGLQVIYGTDLTDGRQSPGAAAGATPEEALKQILGGSGLTFSWLNERTVSIRMAGVGAPQVRPTVAMDSSMDAADAGGGISPSDKLAQVTGSDDTETVLPPGFEGPAAAGAIGEVEVTGSHIRGIEPAGSKVIVIDRQMIEESGYGRLEDIMATLPQNFGGVGEQFTQPVSNSNKGSEIQLRGLGSGTTLTLVNGHRVPSGGLRGLFVDVSSIPTAAIERVEILTDGASAIYGSDAVAGVANIVLRKDYQGAETRVRAGTAKGDGDETQLSQLVGTSWNGGNALLGYQFFDRNAVPFSAREYTAANYNMTEFGGSDFRPQYSMYYGSPGTILDATGKPAYSIPAGQNGSALTRGDLTPGLTNFTDNVSNAEILPAQTTHSAFLSVSQSLNDRVEVYADGRFSTRELDFSSGPPLMTVSVPRTNPFYVNPFGTTTPVRVAYDFTADLGPVTTLATTDTYSMTMGSIAHFGEEWQMKLDASYGRERVSTDLIYLTAEATAAINTALADTNRDTALNVFGDGSNTNPATLERIRSLMHQKSRGISTVWSSGVVADGPLFSIGDRAARLAVGADYRNEELETITTASVTSGRSVSALFSELALPLFSKLDASIAARFEDYDDFGTTLNPKIGLSYAPVSGVKLRGTWGTSFRAPPFARSNELISLPRATVASVADPQSATGTSRILRLTGNNAELSEETANVWTAGIDLAPKFLPNVRFSTTYFQIDYEDRIDAVVPTLTRESQYGELVRRGPTQTEIDSICSGSYVLTGTCTGIVAILDARQRNISVVKMKGLDFELSHSLRSRFGNWSYGTGGTYLLSDERALTEAANLIDVVDTIGNPVSLRFRGFVTWSLRGLTIGSAVNHTGDYTDDTQLVADHVNSFTTVDLSATLRAPDSAAGWLSDSQLIVSAVNAFDEAPPFVNTITGYDGANASILGRMLSVQIVKSW